jgi:hypothetical protein
MGLVVAMLALAVVACEDGSPSPSPTPSMPPDLSAIACAEDDPDDVGGLTGAWQGDDGFVYYIRHVGDCVWWFGTELVDIQPGVTGQAGIANVASGRVSGTRLEMEWADLPMGNLLGGGGLTLVYDGATDQLTVIEQRGDWIPYGATTLTRIVPESSPETDPSASPSP